jgi:hypothetical protein
MRSLTTKVLSLAAVGVVALAGLSAGAQAQANHTSKPFQGPKANTGTVTHSVANGKHLLTLSDDFKVPDTPDPHWQVVTTKGQVFLLQRVTIKDNKINKTITLPAFITDVAKVQIYCAWAEALLGEASFSNRVTTE